MVAKSQDVEFVSLVVDLMQSIGPVGSKRMFGGFGIFLQDLMFGLIADNELYLKADASNQAEFDDLGLQPFSYNKNGTEMKMSYYQAPEEALEDSEAMNRWAGIGYAAALRAAARKQKKIKNKKKKESCS